MRNVPGIPYTLDLDTEMLADLRGRVQAARFPAQQAGPDWQTGMPLAYMRRLQTYWLETFDWGRWVDRINVFEQRMINVAGEQIHVIIEQGSGSDPLPLVMSHGWPGSFIEFLDMIDRLAHPERHGGRIEDAFTVIIPSLPGYGLSPAPTRPLAASDMAALWSSLMVDCFQVDHFVAYGSDWGSIVTAAMAFNHPQRLDGVMMTIAGAAPDFAAGPPMRLEERQWVAALQDVQRREGAYQEIQATKPQTLSYAQTDSPIGLAAWIIEKFQGWSVPDADGDPPFSMDLLLANVMLYWINGSLAPSWLYMFMDEIRQPRAEKAKVPAAFLVSCQDLFPQTPRALVERIYDVADYKAVGTSHFPGLDNPDLLVAELRRMLLPLGRKAG